MARIQLHILNFPGPVPFGLNWEVHKQTWLDRLMRRDGKLLLKGWAPDEPTARIRAANAYHRRHHVEPLKGDL